MILLQRVALSLLFASVSLLPLVRAQTADANSVAAVAPAAQSGSTYDPYGMTFKAIGCKGMWPLGKLSLEPIIAAHRSAKTVTFKVRNPQSCGLAVRKPTVAIEDVVIKLGYEAFADGTVAACLCDFHSEFKFKNLPSSEIKPTFDMRFAP